MRYRLIRLIFKWLPLATAITVICGIIYGAVQQDVRQSGNNPQIQIAEDTASALSTGQPAQSLIPSQNIDMSKSLAPFVILYDNKGHVIASSGYLNGKVPSMPSGVFESVKTEGEDHFTWEPKPQVRIAAVVTQFQGKQSGFVLCGKSLLETENLEGNLENIILLGWLACMLITLLQYAWIDKLQTKGL